MANQYTHEAYIVGVDSRVSRSFRVRVKLRATKRYWITEKGLKFRRERLLSLGEHPIYKLESAPVEIGGISG
jgi:hypothetical protein